MPRKPDYVVGYGRPPKKTRFRKGQSGNPKGTKKGTVRLATVLDKALNERVTVTENGRRKTITKLEAMMKQLVNRAASGDIKSQQLLVGVIRVNEDRPRQDPNPSENPMREADQLVMKQLIDRVRHMDKGESDA